ncbi:glycosyl hydrolase 53 family protein [Demequina soli]|uniref:glycosyl hydrolase 53 family protein n=1 Tax=Demequina soli TaxID=1638987 RepID=UPI000AAAB14D|nr:glycosyl hydrolase 53 family protein [Demequina soli]
MRQHLRSSAAAAGIALCGVVAGSGVAAAATDEPVDAGITVPKVENLSSDFMNGVDVSSILSLEESGVTFKDFDGQQADIFDVMAEAGINYVRVRVWNDPYDASGHGYGGGDVDAARATEIGQRATAAGMKVFVDFHYSDFWAHPGQQTAPKAWVGMSAAQKATALYDYTAATLQEMEDAGVDVGMVQIGNETTNLQLAGENWPASGALFKAGSDAVRATVPDAKVAVHFTNPEKGTFAGYADKLAKGADGVANTGDEIDYDVFASSYYAYWHGTTANLTAQLKNIADTYGKDVIVAETSWAYTLDDGDGYENNITTAYDQYSTSVQGQALAVRDVMAAVADVGDAGLGVFYWEPAWLPVGPPDQLAQNQQLWERDGSGWASSYAGEYSADAAANYGGSGWDNQAMFAADGTPLESLRVFDYARYGTVAPRAVDSVTSPSITVTDGDAVALPTTVTVRYTDGTSEEQSVTWQAKASWITGPGTYTVAGTTASGLDATATVTVLSGDATGTNVVVNGGFELGTSPWVGSGSGYTIHATDDPYAGTYATHFYKSTAYSFTISQDIPNVPAGTYRLSAKVQGGDAGASDAMYITAASGIASVSAPFSLNGWAKWQSPTTGTLTVLDGATVSVSATFNLSAGAWGTIDAFELVAETPVVEVDTAALEALVAEAGDVDRDASSAVTLLALDRAVARAGFILGSPAPGQASVDAAADALQAALDGLEPGDGTIPDPTVSPVTLSVVDGDAIALPGTVTVVAYDDSTTADAVVWHDSVDWIDGPGVYTVTGVTENGRTATATITVTARALLPNGGFENGSTDASPWSIVASPWPDSSVGTFWVNGNGPRTGAYALNLWNGTGAPFEVSASQDITGLAAGTYRLAGYVEGGGTADLALTATSAVAKASAPIVFGAWNEWVPVSTDVEVGEDGTLTVAFAGTAGAGAWGYLDDLSLVRVDVAEADTSALEAALAAAGGLDRSLYTDSTLAALDLAVEKGRVVLGAETPAQAAVDAATGLVEDAIATLERKPLEFGTAPRPAIAGVVKAGSVLTADAGTWEPSPATLTYQWMRDGEPVAGATGATYRVTGNDRASVLSVAVTGTRPGYVARTVTSAPVEVSAKPGQVVTAG